MARSRDTVQSQARIRWLDHAHLIRVPCSHACVPPSVAVHLRAMHLQHTPTSRGLASERERDPRGLVNAGWWCCDAVYPCVGARALWPLVATHVAHHHT